MDPARCITQFDSATSLLYALASALRGRPFAGQGLTAPVPAWVGDVLNRLPWAARAELYRWSGWWTSIEAEQLQEISAERVAEWVVAQYPQRTYPAAMVGCANGAAIHLAAALGSPWLPQTCLITVRRLLRDADALLRDVEWGQRVIGPLLSRNPDWRAHQMHDPVQDRLMVSTVAYFRMKRLALGPAYETFLSRQLPAGATLISVECELSWPVTRLGERHLFQVGGLGATTPEEYLGGSARVAEFLRAQGSRMRHWEVPAVSGVMPEAEWGFAAEQRADLERLSARQGVRLARLVFRHPEDISPWTADLYRFWYARRGITARRLLAECFALTEPWWVPRMHAIPLWLAFHGEPSARLLARYLEAIAPIDEAYALLLSNGIESIGFVPAAEWETILRKARYRGELIGQGAREFPRDLRSFFRYHDDLLATIPERFEPPAALTLEEVEQFVADTAGRYPVTWTVAGTPAPAVSEPV